VFSASRQLLKKLTTMEITCSRAPPLQECDDEINLVSLIIPDLPQCAAARLALLESGDAG